ncbi:hypothetical protein ACFO4O_13260 [Glaciecola siphonariae]|uniref:Uncharacterized protein n=1 Tax=Glaciecola siphonariae TaxID=521012 RepID=A0ABV9LX39_9ALTE
MSKITTRQVSQLKDVLSDAQIKCVALVKQVSKPKTVDCTADESDTHEYSQEHYIIAQVDALNIGAAKGQFASVEVVIDTDSALECSGIYTSLQKAKNDGVYVVFDAAFLAVSNNRALLQGARAEITNVKHNAYFNLMSLGSLTK